MPALLGGAQRGTRPGGGQKAAEVRVEITGVLRGMHSKYFVDNLWSLGVARASVGLTRRYVTHRKSQSCGEGRGGKAMQWTTRHAEEDRSFS